MLDFPCEILFCFVVCNCMSDYIYTHLFMHVSRPEVGCGWLFSIALHLVFLNQGLTPNPELTVSSGLAALGSPESVCPFNYKLLHHAEAGGTCSCSQCLTRGAEDLTPCPQACAAVGDPLSQLSRGLLFDTLLFEFTQQAQF